MPPKPGKDLKADVIVVGGGHAGCSMAALLGQHGISVICIDQDDPATTLAAAFDGRTTAISYGSQRVIAAAGAWDDITAQACPIADIQITESGSPVLLEFLAEDIEGTSAFGWIVENRLLRKSLYESLHRHNTVTHLAPAKVEDYTLEADQVIVHLNGGRVAKAPLVIGADGKNSFTRDWMGIATRGWSYSQRAIVCVVQHDSPHNHVAVEDFREEGPFAILPMVDADNGTHRSSIVWTEHGPERKSAMYWDEDAFNAALNERFPAFYGKVRVTGRRFSYPLSLRHAHRYVGPRMALVADAAHAIHPIAGQGLNIGLRDIAVLAELLVAAKKAGQDLGGEALLQSYERARRFDNLAMAAATDTLNKLFSNGLPPVRTLRRIGLRAVQKLTPARKFFMKQAMGASGLLPTLIRTGKLT